MDFTDDNTLSLISEFEKHPVLWNPKDKFYKLNNKKKDAWDEIASVFKVNRDVLKKKMNSILNSYRRERHKVNTKTSEMAANEVYTSTWFAYNALNFLHTIYQPRPTKNTTETPPMEPYVQQDDLTDNEVDEIASTSAESTASDTQTASITRTPASGTKRRYKMMTVEKSIDKFQKMASNCTEDDEFDYFGKSIAVQLKKMPLDRALICQEKLQAVMKEERLYQLNHLSAPVFVSVSPPQSCSNMSYSKYIKYE